VRGFVTLGCNPSPARLRFATTGDLSLWER
jgi:hypothetical protein